MNQRVRQPLPARVLLLATCKAPPPPLACILPRQGPLATQAYRMDGGAAAPLAPALRALAGAGRRLAVGDHAGLAHALPLAWGIKAISAVARGASEVAPDLLGPLLPGVEPLRPQDQGRRRPGRAWQGSHHSALGGAQGADGLALVGLGSRLPPPLPPWGATVAVPAPYCTRRSRRVSEASWANPGHARWPERPSRGPWGHRLVDGRVMQGRGPMEGCRDGQALPRPPGGEEPPEEGQNPVRAQWALRSTRGHRQGRHEPCGALRCGAWAGPRRRYRLCCRGAPEAMAACQAG